MPRGSSASPLMRQLPIAGSSQLPVEPKPPSPRPVAVSVPVGTKQARLTRARTSCAMRSPGSMLTASSPQVHKDDLHFATIVGINGTREN